ncbi:MAG: hypothetical protein VX874_20340 [Pseudomonadota bacterium]|nr:hypothetical protein [Pseudomonadota bacterium]
MRMLRALFAKPKARAYRTKVVIYRPVSAVGIGHLLFSTAIYGALARELGARFIVTARGTVFDDTDDGGAFFSRFLVPEIPKGLDLATGHQAIRDALAAAQTDEDDMVVIGRQDGRQRPAREFGPLRNADFIDRWDEPALTPDALGQYDMIYADSVVPEIGLTRLLSDIPPLFRPHPRIVALAKATVPEEDYVAVHLRHGNGEHLHGRTEGSDPAFTAYLEKVADTARAAAEAAGVRHVVCLSDNHDTAQRLAELTGGRALSPDDLPTQDFRAFLRDSGSSDEQEARLTRILVDITILARARRIVGGHSLFCHAAALWGDLDRLTLVSPDGTTATFGELPRP